MREGGGGEGEIENICARNTMHAFIELKFLNNLWGQEPSRNSVIVPARQAT